ncbi:MAG: hypothetical protein QGH34_03725, partial [Candidatus Woesearchaeota archaeon]|nr:hypothetical protein [Candidatus Woesearchaeota archaeon]
AMLVIVVSIAISLIAFISANSKITGFTTSTSSDANSGTSLREYDDVNSLETLAAGSYYVDGDGIVYWVDDESKPAVAKVKFVQESQKNRQIYVDNNGNIGYLIG